MRDKAITVILTGALLAIAACATTKGYVLCNDLGNAVCPANTANVIVN